MKKKPPEIVYISAKILAGPGSGPWPKNKTPVTPIKKPRKSTPSHRGGTGDGPPAAREGKAAINPYWAYLSTHFGKRLIPKKHGYWLDGHWISFDLLMRTMNRDRKARSLPEVGIEKNPAWRA